MRNFYDQPTSKIFDKMFGKGARQIQADPTLDTTKCKCCQCDKAECKGCMQGAVMGPDAGCCPSKNESLIFEYSRPESKNNSPCCRSTFGGYQYQCCSTTKIEAPNVRYSYHYVGKFFRIDYSATGNYFRNGNITTWPENNLPRLCSYCDPSSNKANGYCDCMDYAPLQSIDDTDGDSPCHIGYGGGGCIAPFQNCLCMGSGVFKNTNRDNQRLSHYRRKQMEREPYYRWLLDIMCYDGGNIIKNPWIGTNEETRSPVINNTNGTLYNHLVGVVHCEHWWELDRCPQNPNVDFAAEGFPNVNSSCFVPRFWIQACSGVPVFDWEFIDAVEKNHLGEGDLTEVWSAIATRQTPPQDIMNRMSAGGYFDTGDWRQSALNEIKDLQGRTYTKDSYSNLNIPLCSDFKYLGPVRKKFFRENVFLEGQDGYDDQTPGFLNPRKARQNVINRNPAPVLGESLQLPSQYLPDPWNGQYPPPTTPSSSPEEIAEYQDFIAWRESQWLYMHARPGGWDYVCAGYYDGTSDIKIPDLRRRYMNDAITCQDPEEEGIITRSFGGCLAGILGVPQKSIQSDCSGLGDTNPEVLIDCPDAEVLPCGSFSCFDLECVADVKCASYKEQGGGISPCEAVMVESNCEGMVFAYSRESPKQCGVNRVFNWPTTRRGKAWLYKVNITTGNYSSFCPHTCRSLSTPKPISTEFESIFKKRQAHKSLCNNFYSDPIETLLPCPYLKIPDGKYCFNIGECVEYSGDGEICGDYHSDTCFQYCFNSGDLAPYYWGGEPECCGKDPGLILEPDPVPQNPTHPAFSNGACKICGPGGGEGGIYGPDGCPSLGCCWDCCDATVRSATQNECYGSRDPNDPLYAHIIWVPSVNGVDCGNNTSPCGSSYPACP